MSEGMSVLLLSMWVFIMVFLSKSGDLMKHKKCKKNLKGICTYYSREDQIVMCKDVNYLCEWEEER